MMDLITVIIIGVIVAATGVINPKAKDPAEVAKAPETQEQLQKSRSQNLNLSQNQNQNLSQNQNRSQQKSLNQNQSLNLKKRNLKKK